MSSPFRVFPLLLGLAVLEAPAQTTVQGEPFGYVKINIAAGSGTAKKTSLVSVPLLSETDITGSSKGIITGVASNTITVAGAGWVPGQLSNPADPHLLEITSGNNQGRILLLSTVVSNTEDTTTIDPKEVDRVGNLANMISVGPEGANTYRIRPVDTLLSLFGTPSPAGILGGATPADADTVTIVNNGSATTYFYKTNVITPRWSTASFPFSDASHVAIPPFAGLRYDRKASLPLQITVIGAVPSGYRRVSVKNSGSTVLSSYWPVSQTLSDLALQSIPNWQASSVPSTADTLVVSSGGSTATFYHDGTNWRGTSFPRLLANTNIVPVGSSVIINKRGTGAGYTQYQHLAPYSLQ